MVRDVVRGQVQNSLIAQRLSTFSPVAHRGFVFNLGDKIPHM